MTARRLSSAGVGRYRVMANARTLTTQLTDAAHAAAAELAGELAALRDECAAATAADIAAIDDGADDAPTDERF